MGSSGRRGFLKAMAMVPVVAGLEPARGWSAAKIVGAKSEAEETAVADVGPLRERYEQTLRRVLSGGPPLYSEDFVLADAKPVAERRFTEYSGDVSGRYIGALATGARVYGASSGVDRRHLDSLVGKVIALQKPDGYFGAGFHYDKPTDLDLALLWGNGRLLVGLMEWYALSPKPDVLASARKLGDWLVRIGPLMLSDEVRQAFGAQHFASSYICWTQQTEGLAALYSVTKEERYRSLAEAIFKVTERRPGDHVHGYLSSLRGAMALAAMTKNKSIVDRCAADWAEIVASKDSLMTGGVPEGWSPNNHRTEGCGEADWLRLNLQLWKQTSDQKYLAMAEKTWFNELAFNQFASGDFGHHVYTETGLPAGGAARAWWCCTLHGLRCFPDVSEAVWRRGTDGPNVLSLELPVDGQGDGEELSVRSVSTLERDGKARIRIVRAGKGNILVRRPAWAKELEISVNGRPVEALATDAGYAEVRQEWKPGDEVTVGYVMQLRREDAGGERVSYWYGPWLLGAGAAANPAYFNELTEGNRLLGEGRRGEESGEGQAGGRFAIPVAVHSFQYRHAEYADQLQKVVLRAIAEQGGMETTSWELRFLRG